MDKKTKDLLWILEHNSPKKMYHINIFIGNGQIKKIRRKFNKLIVTNNEDIKQKFTLDPFEFIILR